MTGNSIFVALSTFCEHDNTPLDLLINSGVNYKIHSTGKRITKEEIILEAADYDIIIAGVENYDRNVLNHLKGLKSIVRCGVGVDSIDHIAAKEKNITILNTPDTPTTAVAELALTMYLSLSRNLRMQANMMGEKKWQRLEAHLLSGKTLGIIGFGRIGKKIAELCKPFKLKILVHDPFLTDMEGMEEILVTSKDELLEKSDIVSVHASARIPGTVIIDKAGFLKMKKNAFLVNLSRGGMIDEEALVTELKSGKLAGAALDVFGNEPYNGPLCNFENVILTPHSATLTIETRAAMELECVEKALHFLRGHSENKA